MTSTVTVELPPHVFDTHASIFDSHPNARAHAEVANALAEWVLSKKP